MQIKVLIVGLFIRSFCLLAQTETDIQLAQHYYLNGEFDKAAVYYEKLYEADPSRVNFSRYIDCLNNIKDTKSAEKIYKKQISFNPNDVSLKIQLYSFYKEKEQNEKAKKVRTEISKKEFFEIREIQDVLSNLLSINEFEWAEEVIDKFKKNFKFYPYELWYAQLFLAKGNKINALNNYLQALAKAPDLKEKIQTEISSVFDFSQESEELTLVKNSFLSASQKDPTNTQYTEMLVWFFLQSKNFKAAYQQVSALEKRVKGSGEYLISFANTCAENQEYEFSKDALKEVVSLNLAQKDEARRILLNVMFTQLTNDRSFSKEEIDNMVEQYEQFIESPVGNRSGLESLVLEYAEVLAFYAGKPAKAKSFLETRLNANGLTDMQRAKIKMKLADACVVLDSIWDASLLYMQINEAFKFEPIGNEAKFKNARVFYFDGEFEYAQSQLDVLKQSTSKFISNDAMQLSLLILENYGLDSNYEAMSAFAKTDLYLMQHRYSEAFQTMDSIKIKFPQSVLNDDLLFLRGKAFLQQGNWENAALYFKQLISTYPSELLADDAIFELANVQRVHLNDSQEALNNYLKIIDNYPGSIHADDARTWIRKMRGDKIPE